MQNATVSKRKEDIQPSETDAFHITPYLRASNVMANPGQTISKENKDSFTCWVSYVNSHLK